VSLFVCLLVGLFVRDVCCDFLKSASPIFVKFGIDVDPFYKPVFLKFGWLGKNTAQISASRIFSAEFRVTYLRLTFRLSRIFKINSS